MENFGLGQLNCTVVEARSIKLKRSWSVTGRVNTKNAVSERGTDVSISLSAPVLIIPSSLPCSSSQSCKVLLNFCQCGDVGTSFCTPPQTRQDSGNYFWGDK